MPASVADCPLVARADWFLVAAEKRQSSFLLGVAETGFDPLSRQWLMTRQERCEPPAARYQVLAK
jgi:hypothetical protein